jgi:hypothetical protein
MYCEVLLKHPKTGKTVETSVDLRGVSYSDARLIKGLRKQGFRGYRVVRVDLVEVKETISLNVKI